MEEDKIDEMNLLEIQQKQEEKRTDNEGEICQEKNGQLLEDLRVIWSNFIAEEEDKEKERIIKLFFLLHKYISKIDPEGLNSLNFLKAVPSQLCCYLLELVYGIVCTSLKDSPIEGGDQNDDDSNKEHSYSFETNSTENFIDISEFSTAKFFRDEISDFITDDYRTTPVIIHAPSDITAIISLRKFLTHGLGNLLLDFLHNCDVKTVTSRKSLVHLLVNLFPNTKWDNESNTEEYKMPNDINLEYLMSSFYLLDCGINFQMNHQHNNYQKKSIILSASLSSGGGDGNNITKTLVSSITEELIKISKMKTNKNINLHDNYKFLEDECFNNIKMKTCDEIAYILIDLLENFVNEEKDKGINQNSVTLECLKFSLYNFVNIERTNAFKNENKEILRLKLLSLLIRCINNLFTKKANFFLFDFKIILNKLFYVIELLRMINENSTTELKEEKTSYCYNYLQICLATCIYVIIGILNNILLIYSSKFEKFMEIINETVSDEKISILFNTINDFSLNYEEESSEFVKSLIEQLIKLIINIKIIFTNYKKSSSNIINNSAMNKRDNYIIMNQIRIRKRKKHLFKKQQAARMSKNSNNFIMAKKLINVPKQIHCQNNNLPCFFEKFLLRIFNNLNIANQELILRHLQKNGVCCCLYSINLLEIFSSKALEYDVKIQKIIYKFLRGRFLKTIYSKNLLCSLCDLKMNSSSFANEIFLLYKRKYYKFQEENLSEEVETIRRQIEMKIYLKHLLKISNLLPSEILRKMLFEIILPLFYERKTFVIMNFHRNYKSEPLLMMNINILQKCLCIFINYFKDMRLMKEFFTEEKNVNSLEELLFIPELSKSICDLLRIGINNYNKVATFLADSNESPQLDEHFLYELQLKTTKFLTELIVDDFKMLEKYLKINFIPFKKITLDFCAEKKITSSKGSKLEINTSNSNINKDDNEIIDNQIIENQLRIIKELTTKEIFYLASVFWNFSLELYRINLQYRANFQQIYPQIENSNLNQSFIEEYLRVNKDRDNLLSERNDLNIFHLSINVLNIFLYQNEYEKEEHENETDLKTEENEKDNNLYQNYEDILMDEKNLLSLLYPIFNSSTVEAARFDANQRAPFITNCLPDFLSDEKTTMLDLFSLQKSSLFYLLNNMVDNNMMNMWILLNDKHLNISPKYVSFNGTRENLLPSSYPPSDNDSQTLSQIHCDELPCCNDFHGDNFLEKLKSNSENYIVVFDIKNHCFHCRNNSNNYFSNYHLINEKYRQLLAVKHCYEKGNLQIEITEENRNDSSSARIEEEVEKEAENRFHHHRHHHHSTTYQSNNFTNGFERISSIISYGFHMLFGVSSDDNQQKDENEEEKLVANEKLKCLGESGINKKFLNELFEPLLTIFMMENVEIKGTKMNLILQKLKHVILKNAKTCRRRRKHKAQQELNKDADKTKANTIILALQSLLKVAEMVNRPALDENHKCTTIDTDQRDNSKDEESGNMMNSLSTPVSRRCHRNCKISSSRFGSDTSTVITGNGVNGSHNFMDSEVEITSENDTEEFYLTADEGYDADAEMIQDLTDSEDELESMWAPYIPSSRYRTHCVHEGLSQLIIEILMELSKECIKNPELWTNNLSQLTNRLYIIRDSLGGSQFLLKGFSSILSVNDERLKDFQQSILDLITDLNTPDVLNKYMEILASENPPTEILVRYMCYICSNNVQLQPSAELVFPVSKSPNDDHNKPSVASDFSFFEKYKRIRNYHEKYELETPFTQAACAIPLDHKTKLWNLEGFTVSTWIQMKNSLNLCKSSSSLAIENNSSEIENRNVKTLHLVSMGSNKLMLSVYVANNLSILFKLYKPNEEGNRSNSNRIYQDFNKSEQMKKSSGTPEDKPGLSFFNRRKVKETTTVNEDMIPLQEIHGTENVDPSQASSCSSSSPFRGKTQMDISNGKNKTSRKTSLVNSIFNSLIHFPIFSTTQHEGQNLLSFSETVIELKNCLTKKKWTHLAFAVHSNVNNKEINISVIIDGSEEYDLQFQCRNLNQLIKNEDFQMISLGHQDMNFDTNPHNIDSNNDGNKIEDPSFRFKYGLSNLMIFNKPISGRTRIGHFTALGPDCTNLTQCFVDNILPNYGFVGYNKPCYYDIDSFGETVRSLKESLLLSYSAHNPRDVTFYSCNSIGNFLGEGYNSKIISFVPETYNVNYISSLQIAVQLCGGLSVLLYLFARVVEQVPDSNIQASALDLLLSTAFSNANLYTEFVRRNYMNLIGYVIKTDQCAKDVNILKSVINNACTQPIIVRRSNLIQVLNNSNACIVYPVLVLNVMRRYSDWRRSGSKDSRVLEMLLECLEVLVREKHPHREFNITQLSNAGIIRELLNLCKLYIVESFNPIYISEKFAVLFVNILNIFAGSSPAPSLLDEIVKLLLLIQKPSECFVTHDRSRFYFLVNPDPPIKHKLINLQLPSKQIKHLIRERKKLTQSGGGHSLSTLRKMSTRESSSPDFIKDHQQESSGSSSFNYLNRSRSDLRNDYNHGLFNRKYNIFHAISNPDILETIADCSKIDKKSLSLLNARKLSPMYCASVTTIRANKYPQKNHKRFRTISWSSTTETEIKGKRKKNKSASDSSNDNSTTEMELVAQTEYDIVNSDEVSSLDENKADRLKRMKSFTKMEFYKQKGIIKLQEELYKLLRLFLLILPDNMIEEVLTHYVKAEILLVLLNHHSPEVRSEIIRLLTVLCNRLPVNDLQNLNKKYYWHHLGNQISLNVANKNLVEACIQWCTETYHNLDEYAFLENAKVEKKFAVNALIAILPQTLSTNYEIAVNTFDIITKFYKTDLSCRMSFIENGLIQSTVKTLYKLYMKPNKSLLKIENSIKQLLYTIGANSIKSSGQINVLWEMLHLLTFYQENDILPVVKGFRGIQANVLFNLLQIFLPNLDKMEAANKLNSSDINIPDSTLSSSEIKTRFDLLLDRILQFFLISVSVHQPNPSEIKLFGYAITINLVGSNRFGHLVSWGLLPQHQDEFKILTLKELWQACQDDKFSSIICDTKMIRNLLYIHSKNLNEDNSKMNSSHSFASVLHVPNENSSFYKKCQNDLRNICEKFRISHMDATSHIDFESEKNRINRENYLSKQKPLIEKVIYKFESVASGCIETSMEITRNATELQNSERKILMSQLKEYDESCIYHEWISIIDKMTHEGAPWYCSKTYPRSWELDDTEGPSGIRIRLRRCHLNIKKRFFMEDVLLNYSRKDDEEEESERDDSETERILQKSLRLTSRPLEYLVNAHDQHLHFSMNSRILHNFLAIYLPLDCEVEGELLITEDKIFFVPTNGCKIYYKSCDIEDITEMWLRRYQHQDKAFEIRLCTFKSMFFALQKNENLKVIKDIFADKIVHCPDQTKLLMIAQQWGEGYLTNWEYIMTLNQLSGRTYNDLMQYPVFPWILSNFDSEYLDLTDETNFRILSKPVAVQHKENESHYVNNYNYIDNTMSATGTLQMKPYHYSSHYSNSGTVLHFLVRVPPFTSYFLRYQDNNFDLPDRTFHSINTTWKLASRDSPTDVKELIPEFFCLPEMFENFERFNFGYKQSGELVDDVNLPAWCLHNPRLFVLIHRQALESEIVRSNLHNWVDLIFGYKQTGTAAIEAINVFHPATYSEFHLSNITDPIEKKAVETMIKTYGQMPKQLLKIPHPPSKNFEYNAYHKNAVNTVNGLRWGIYTGSPELPEPKLISHYVLIPSTAVAITRLANRFVSVISLSNTNFIYGLPENHSIMQGAENDIYNMISWKHDDRIIRIQLLSDTNDRAKPLLFDNPIDEITTCGTDTNSNSLWFGHKSGRITVYTCEMIFDGSSNSNLKYKSRQSQMDVKLSYNSVLHKFSRFESKFNKDFPSLMNAGGGVGGAAGSSTGSNFGSTEFNNFRWCGPTVLIRHKDEITSIQISDNFKIAISASKDSSAVIWDLNNFNYIRTIERPADIHSIIPITVAVISPTLGDILTVHSLEKPDTACFEVTEGWLNDFVNISTDLGGKSMLRLHSINGKYINRKICEEQVVCACYSGVKEGTGINVIVTAVNDGTIKFWSSWDLSFIREINIGSEILSLTFSVNQYLVILTKDNYIQVWESEGLNGNPPKFPQIIFK